MSATDLRIEGYRSLKKVTWSPSGLDVLIGPNGTGKSNILRALDLLSRSAQGQLARTIQSEGGMIPLAWDGRAESVRLVVKTPPLQGFRDPERESLTYELALARVGSGGSYRIEHEVLGNYYRVERGESAEPLKLLERRGQRASIFDQQELRLAAPEESVPEEETLLSVTSGPFTQNRLIPLFQQRLATWAVYEDLRVHAGAPIRQPVVTRRETRVAPDGQNLVSVLHTLYTGDRGFKRDIDLAMRAAFGEDYEELVFSPAADQRIQLQVRWRPLRRPQPAADLSDGTLRFLFLLSVLRSPSPAPLIAIDEPEVGLHPSMLPIVAEYVVDAAQRAQVILTTHSPQMLDAFSDTIPSTVVLTWERGETRLNVLPPDKLEYWLKGYSLGKLFTSGELEAIV